MKFTWKTSITRASLFMTFLCALALCASNAPLQAQDTEYPVTDVGRGAPRTALMYGILSPESLLALSGLDQEKPVEQNFIQQMFGPEAGKITEFFVQTLEPASRLDLALIDVSTSGPRVYLDITLKPGQSVDLKPSWLQEELGIKPEDGEINGIPLVRYTIDRDLPELYAFSHQNHLYICFFESVVQDLCRGLSRGLEEGESLAEQSRFREWYATRSNADIELWVNAYELRRWVERVLPSDSSESYEQADGAIDLRNWKQFVLSINHRSENFDIELKLESRKDIPLLKELALPQGNFARFDTLLPAETILVAAGNIGEPAPLWQRVQDDLDSLSQLLLPIFEGPGRNYDKYDEDEKWDEIEPEAPEKWEDEKQAGPGDEKWEDEKWEDEKWEEEEWQENEREAPSLEEMVEFANEVLEPLGLDFESSLELFEGSGVFGMTSKLSDSEPQEESRMAEKFPLPFFALLPIHKVEKITEALEQLLEEGGEEFNLKKEDTYHYYTFEAEGFYGIVYPHQDLLLLALSTSPEESLELFQIIERKRNAAGISASPFSPLLQESSQMTFGIKLGQLLQDYKTLDQQKLKKFSAYIDPHDCAKTPFSLPKESASSTSTLGFSLDTTPKSLRFKLSTTGLSIVEGINSWLALESGPADRLYYASSQLENLYEKINYEFRYEEDRFPASFDELLEAEVIRLAYLQSPFDARFVQGAIPYWFTGDGLDDEWYQEEEGIAEVLASEAKGFRSYAMVPANIWEQASELSYDENDRVIVIYEEKANTFGGHMVLYASGRFGWLHKSNWEQAKALIAQGKPLPE